MPLGAGKRTSMEDANAAVLQFCQARERLAKAERETKDTRAERNDAERTLGAMVRESMQTHGLTSVMLEDRRRVCLVPGTRRSVGPKSIDDALSLVENVKTALGTEDLRGTSLTQAILRIARDRMKDRGPPPGPPRLVFKAPVISGKSESSTTPDETKRLLTQYVDAHRDCRESREQLAPLRAAKRRATEALTPLLEEPAIVRVKTGPGDEKGRLLRVARTEAKTSETPKEGKLGVRTFLTALKEAVTTVLERSMSVQSAAFEKTLVEELRRRLESMMTSSSTTPIRRNIQVRVVKGE